MTPEPTWLFGRSSDFLEVEHHAHWHGVKCVVQTTHSIDDESWNILRDGSN